MSSINECTSLNSKCCKEEVANLKKLIKKLRDQIRENISILEADEMYDNGQYVSARDVNCAVADSKECIDETMS